MEERSFQSSYEVSSSSVVISGSTVLELFMAFVLLSTQIMMGSKEEHLHGYLRKMTRLGLRLIPCFRS